MKSKFITLAAFITFACFTANAQSGRKSNLPDAPRSQTVEKRGDQDQKEEMRGDIQPVKIIRRPAPDAAAVARCFRNEGFSRVKTVLRVTFDASAKITDVEIKTPSGCSEFDEESVDAARNIKFMPAV